MKKVSNDKIVIVTGIVILAVATWFAARPPAPPLLASAQLPSSTPPSTAPLPTSTTTQTLTPKSSKPATPAPITLSLGNPKLNAQWIIGDQNTISWNKPAGVTGQMWLVNVSTGIVAGWIMQNVAPAQTYFSWNTRDISLSETNPAKKDVTPGKYIIKMSFSSPNVLPITSAPFFIVAAQ